jgi:phage gpG-like protein
VADNDSIMVGSGLVYARIHQEGGPIVPRAAAALVFRLGEKWVRTGKVTMPARPYLGLSPDNQNDVVEAAEDWLGRLLQ